MTRCSRTRRFGLIDALIVVACLGLLFCLMLPFIQASRETARAAECSSNLKKIVLGLHHYHDTYRTFPSGARTTGKVGESERMGPAWWFGLLPFMEQRNLYDRIMTTQLPGTLPQAVPFNAAGINPVSGNVLARSTPSWMCCPSSPLPVTEHADGPILLATYVGIAGGCDLDPQANEFSAASFPELRAPQSDQVYKNRAKGAALYNGIMTDSGMLVPNVFTNMAKCTDGTSNTIIVGEQSDWLRDADPNSEAQLHGDPGWDTEGTAGTGPQNGGGFLSGAAVSTRLPTLQGSGAAPAPWGVDCYNVTTVRYGLNVKRVLGARPHPGCSEDHGVNNPLQSAHRTGVHVAFVDGSVLALAEHVDLAVLLRMVIRDDGQNVRDQPSVPPHMLDDAEGPVGEPASPGAPPTAPQDATAAEKVALGFVRAAFLDRDVDGAVSFVSPNAMLAGHRSGSVVQNLQQIPRWPSAETLKLRQMHLFRRENIEALAKLFPRLDFERVSARIADGLGCVVVFSITTPDGTLRKAHLIFIIGNVDGEMKVVCQDDGS